MQRVFVLDNRKQPLMPCHPARARELLKKGKAAVWRMQPFTIILKNRDGGDVQPVEAKVDPGSHTTGMALVALYKRGYVALWGANLEHRGHVVKDSLEKRRAIRRDRRNRKTRYRQPRFDNRCRPDGWLPPSLMSRVNNIRHWMRKLKYSLPVTSIAVETVRFDLQKMQRPEISGVEYQQGELFGYEVREYLLEKWGRECVYCGTENVPLEVEHIVAKSRNGSDRVSNLTIACKPCNADKNNQDVRVWLKDKARLDKILRQAKTSLKDAAAVNVTRFKTLKALNVFGLPVTSWSGGRTKYNRTKQGYRKDHWIDACCVGESGQSVYLPETLKPLLIKAQGRGSRQMCRVDKYGFPRTKAKKQKQVNGFQTGDLVKAVVTKGKKVGIYVGRAAVRTSGSFNIKARQGIVQGINSRYCQLIQAIDGYSYAI